MNKLKKVLKIIDNYNFSNKTIELLKKLFIYNEMYIDCDYKLNSINLSMSERIKLKSDCRDIKREMKCIFDYFHLYILKTKTVEKVEPYVLSVKEILENKKINLNKYNYNGWNKKEKQQEEETQINEKPKKTK